MIARPASDLTAYLVSLDQQTIGKVGTDNRKAKVKPMVKTEQTALKAMPKTAGQDGRIVVFKLKTPYGLKQRSIPPNGFLQM
ncbi:MAG: hypothetical protein ABIL62_13985 [Planctomycetota bacterium]